MKKLLFNTRLGRIALSAAVIILCITGLQLLTAGTRTADEEDATYQQYFNNNYKIFSLNLPTKLEFAGEKVPMKLLDVREKLDRELLVNTYWQSQSLLLHKRANRWFPVIEPILKKNGVPDDFKYLCVIESGLQNVVSPAGAVGFWQMMQPTAETYGLEVDAEVDERYNVAKSTEAACKYLKDAYQKYGSWTLAAASYNIGMNGLDTQLKKQKADNYYDLLLNEETSRYVYRILAMKEIIGQPTRYGFHFRPKDLYPPYQYYTVKVDSSISDFATFAEHFGINYKILKLLNPWLRQSYLTNSDHKKYQIEIPKKGTLELLPTDSLGSTSDSTATVRDSI